MKIWLEDLIGLLYPRTCSGCNKLLSRNEAQICIICQSQLPKCRNYLSTNPLLLNKFAGKVDITFAFSYLQFVKEGLVQRLLYALKYENQTEVGLLLANWLGADFEASADIKNIDLIVPIPLHKKKLKSRGFNQSEIFSRNFSQKLDIKHCTKTLIRSKSTTTQTRKSRIARWFNVSTAFDIQDESEILGKHVLIIDDIITTGATFEAAAVELLKHGARKVSVLAIAETK